MSEAEHSPQPNIGSEVMAASECRATDIYILRERWPGHRCDTYSSQSRLRHSRYITDPPPHHQDYGHCDGVRQLLSASMTITVCQWPGLRVRGGTLPGHGVIRGRDLPCPVQL